jgi:hypothetical protein
MLAIVMNGYGFLPEDPVLEVELGEDAVTDDGIKWCSRTMKILRVVPREEVYQHRGGIFLRKIGGRKFWSMCDEHWT